MDDAGSDEAGADNELDAAELGAAERGADPLDDTADPADDAADPAESVAVPELPHAGSASNIGDTAISIRRRDRRSMGPPQMARIRELYDAKRPFTDPIITIR